MVDKLMLEPTSGAVARQESYGSFLENLESRLRLCEILERAGVVRSRDNAFAVALQGAELGLSAMTSLNHIRLVDSQMILSPALMTALILRDLPGTRFELDEGAGYCQVTVIRPGWRPYVARVTMDDARRAGLLEQENWRRFPALMLRSWATANACRAVAPDVLVGVYGPGPATVDSLGSKADGRTPANEDPEGVLGLPTLDAHASVAETRRHGVAAKAAAEPETEPQAPELLSQPAETGSWSAMEEPAPSSMSGPIAAPLASQLQRLKRELGIGSSQWRSLLSTYGVESAENLSADQTDELVQLLQRRAALEL